VTAPPDTRWAKSGDISIAYQVVGDGPIDIVFVPGFVSHVELIWDVPILRHILDRLSSFARLIHFDKRGTGLSDRTAALPTLEERADDIRAVMHAVGTERAALVAVSEGGQAGLYFAAAHPAMVSELVVWASGAGLGVLEPATVAELLQRAELLYAFMEANWGTGQTMSMLTGGTVPPADLARFERNAATPRAATDVGRRMVASDATAVLGAITAPTLVVSRRGDPILGNEVGPATAARIRGARLLELDGDFHLGGRAELEDDALDAIEEFLTGHKPPVMTDRVLATVLFTDIVDSTRRASDLGDAQWRRLLDAHDHAVRSELARFSGREVNTTGDGFVAIFDGPARAVRCAQAAVGRVRDLGLDVRSGVHVGEVEQRGDDIAGMGVHIASRVAGAAGSGEVLVSSTVRDLTVGSGLEFEDAGLHELKGVPGDFQLLRVIA